MKIIFIYLSLFFICTSYCIADSQFRVIKIGKSFASPDERFVVCLGTSSNEFKQPVLKITDRHALSKTQISEIGIVPPLYGIFWLNNSKAFCSIEHISVGSELEIHYINNGNWDTFLANPTSDYSNNSNSDPDYSFEGYYVTDVRANFDSVLVTYKTWQQNPPVYYLVKMMAYVSTQKVKLISAKRISVNQYNKL